MREYLGQSDAWFAERGLTRTRVGPTMLTRAASTVVRAGGVVLLVYGAAETAGRIADATPDERPVVVSEEAGAWTGGWIGSVLTEAIGGAFLCSETGPGAFVCALVLGIAGGAAGGAAGHSFGHDIGEGIRTLQHATPAQLLEGSVQMFGTDEQRRQYYGTRDVLEGAF
jgi:hypothetical protein